MEHIAKRAGIAKGSLYLHTQNRADLIAEVWDRWAADVEVSMRRTAHGSSDAVARACTALFQDVTGNDEAAVSVAIPCCLSRGAPVPTVG
jgi:AcrR family transcriptional regulator